MSFAATGSIFRQDPARVQQMMGDRYDPNKKYPHFSGSLKVPQDQVAALVHYLQTATPDERGQILIDLSGWDAQSANLPWYMSVKLGPDRRAVQMQQQAIPVGAPGMMAAPPAAPAAGGWAPPSAPAPVAQPAPQAQPAAPGWGAPQPAAPGWGTAQPF